MVKHPETEISIMKKTLCVLADLPRNRRHKLPSRPLQEAPGLVKRQKESERKAWVG